MLRKRIANKLKGFDNLRLRQPIEDEATVALDKVTDDREIVGANPDQCTIDVNPRLTETFSLSRMG